MKAGLALRRHLAVLDAQLCNLLLSSLIAGVNLGRVEKFCQCALIVAAAKQLAALHHVRAGSVDAHPVKRCLVAEIVWSLGQGFLVEVERGVVVFPRFRGFTVFEEGTGRLGAQRNARQARYREQGEERNPDTAARKSESGEGRSGPWSRARSGASRYRCAAIHRTPRRRGRPGLRGRLLRAALAAPDAISFAIPIDG